MPEKDYNPEQKMQKSMKKTKVAEKTKKNVVKNVKKETATNKEKKLDEKGTLKKDIKKEEKKPEKKITKPKKKRTEAIVNSRSVPVSTKKARDVCKFIKRKSIKNAIKELEEVMQKRKAVPMKGEIPHRKGKIMSGGFPINTAKQFIVLLKGLAGNAEVNEVDNPIITEAIANKASAPFGRFGRWKRKRTHIKLVAKEKKTGDKK